MAPYWPVWVSAEPLDLQKRRALGREEWILPSLRWTRPPSPSSSSSSSQTHPISPPPSPPAPPRTFDGTALDPDAQSLGWRLVLEPAAVTMERWSPPTTCLPLFPIGSLRFRGFWLALLAPPFLSTRIQCSAAAPLAVAKTEQCPSLTLHVHKQPQHTSIRFITFLFFLGLAH